MRRAVSQHLGAAVRRSLGQQSSNAVLQTSRRSYADEAGGELKKTMLYDYHVENGGKMVPFAGWLMPIQYKDSIMESTTNCRSQGSLFDVSHMCGLSLKGPDAIDFLESLVVADIKGLEPGTGTLSVFTNETGGVIDDTVITKNVLNACYTALQCSTPLDTLGEVGVYYVVSVFPRIVIVEVVVAIDDTVVTKVTDDHIYLVVNAGCRDKDLAHLGKHLKPFQDAGKAVGWHIHDERSLLALQGPLSGEVLQALTKEDLSKMYFSDFKIIDINGSECFLTRTGYTGEDGFEISVPDEAALDLAKAIIEKGKGGVRLTGLGARDSLRLEAGLCLYGNDLEQNISPIEAGLAWTVGKRRRGEANFLGAEAILKQIKDGVTRRRVGFISTGAPARAHSEILDLEGKNIGEITSGGFSPCLKKNISMGYIATGQHKNNNKVKVTVRSKAYDATVTKMPFVPAKYYKAP